MYCPGAPPREEISIMKSKQASYKKVPNVLGNIFLIRTGSFCVIALMCRRHEPEGGKNGIEFMGECNWMEVN
jgi:hypothetical protein